MSSAPDEEPVDPDDDPGVPAQRREFATPHRAVVLAAIAVGGVAGAEARYGLGLAVPHGAGQWPWATLLINVSGCLLIGVLMVVLLELGHPHPLARPLLGVGVLGGYTTFSAFSLDSMLLYERGETALAALYVLASVALSIGGLFAGLALVRHFS